MLRLLTVRSKRTSCCAVSNSLWLYKNLQKVVKTFGIMHTTQLIPTIRPIITVLICEFFFHSILRELKYGEFSLNFTITLFYCLPLTSIKSIFRVNTVSHRYRTICNQLILKLCSFSSTVENNFARTIDIINTPENVQCNISMKIDVMYFHSINGHFHCSTNVVFVVEKFPIFFFG